MVGRSSPVIGFTFARVYLGNGIIIFEEEEEAMMALSWFGWMLSSLIDVEAAYIDMMASNLADGLSGQRSERMVWSGLVWHTGKCRER